MARTAVPPGKSQAVPATAERTSHMTQGPHLVALVRAGARFENGKLVERPDETTPKEAA